jgi:CRP-like cAMP-binding protein
MQGAGKRSQILERQFYSAGKILFNEGDINTRAWYVEKGKLEVFIRDPKGREIRLDFVGPGQIIGEMALISKDEKRTASVRIAEDSTLVSISHDIQRTLEDMDPPIRALIETLAARVRKSNKNILNQKTELLDLEEAATMTVSRVAEFIPEAQQEKFKKEITPVLENLKTVLQKYKPRDGGL